LPIHPKKTSKSLWQTRIGGKKIPLRDLAVFCRKTAFLLDSGLQIKEAIPILCEQTSGALGNVLPKIHSDILQGESFSHALKTAGASVFMCGYVKIGERTARLPEVCSRLADFHEAQAQTEEELHATMIYPAAVATMMLCVIVMAVTFVLPGYSQIFDASGVALPQFTSILLRASDFLSRNIFFVLVVIFFVVASGGFFFRGEKGRALSARLKLKIPILKQRLNCDLTQALSMLLASGLSVSDALPMCADMTNSPIVRRDLSNLSAKVNSGAAFWRALQEISYINPLLVELARVGEETGNLPRAMEKCSAYFEASYRHALRRLNKLVEPAITLILGVVLAAIMLAIILPTFELATAI
jgi:type IV pilus assembly protein PilC